MLSNPTERFRLEKKAIIKVLVVEKYKSYEIFRIMCDEYGKEFFSKNIFTNGAKRDFS